MIPLVHTRGLQGPNFLDPGLRVLPEVKIKTLAEREREIKILIQIAYI